MGDDDADFNEMKIVGVSFQNYYQYKRTVDIDVKKNYLQLTGGTIAYNLYYLDHLLLKKQVVKLSQELWEHGTGSETKLPGKTSMK